MSPVFVLRITPMKSLSQLRDNGTSLFDRIRDEMDDAFRRVLGPPTNGSAIEATAWMPTVDVEDTEKAVVVKADLPGVDPKDIDVSIQNGALTIRGQRQEEKEDKTKNYYRMERFTGSFYRVIPLPAGADETSVSASSTKGVLTINIPKKPEAKGKKITVQSKD